MHPAAGFHPVEREELLKHPENRPKRNGWSDSFALLNDMVSQENLTIGDH